MFSLSRRAKDAIKPALAMTIAYGVSLGMGWDNPYWAGFAVAMISLSSIGQSLNKGALRLLGTLLAAVTALILIACFAQDRWWFIAVLSLYLGVCAYMFTGKQRTYFWWCAAFVCLVISVHSVGAESPFEVAVLRVQQTGLGILAYTLVSAFLWPSDTRGSLEQSTRELLTVQAGLFRDYRDHLDGTSTEDASGPLRLQELGLLGQQGQALNAAETDSYEVWETRHQWRTLHGLCGELMETLERWRESFTEVQHLDRAALMPGLESVYDELEVRFQQIDRMLAGTAPSRLPQPLTLATGQDAADRLSHFEKAALAMNRHQLGRLEALSRALFSCTADIRHFPVQPASTPPARTGTGREPTLDVDRLQASLRTAASVWAAFLIWFYFDPPGHDSFVLMGVIWTMAAAMNGLMAITLAVPMLMGALFAGGLYLFVMPELSGYTQLGSMIFATTFAIYYLFWQPRQGLAKMGAIVMFLNVISVQVEQTYSFQGYALTVAALCLGFMLAIAMDYLPPSPRPEKVFLRLLSRFFKHCEFLMSRMNLDWEREKGLVGRWRSLYFQAELLGLAQKLATWGGKIDARAFPGNHPEQVQAMARNLQALALRMKELSDTRDLPQADVLVRELLGDVRAWRLVMQEQLRAWSDDPSLALAPSAELRERLMARLHALEARVDETYTRLGPEGLDARDYENFYRLLACFRGVSEAGIGCAQASEQINWTQWQQARF